MDPSTDTKMSAYDESNNDLSSSDTESTESLDSQVGGEDAPGKLSIQWKRSCDAAMKVFNLIQRESREETLLAEKHATIIVKTFHDGHAGVSNSYTMVDSRDPPGSLLFGRDIHLMSQENPNAPTRPFFYLKSDIMKYDPHSLLEYDLTLNMDFLARFCLAYQETLEHITGNVLPGERLSVSHLHMASMKKDIISLDAVRASRHDTDNDSSHDVLLHSKDNLENVTCDPESVIHEFFVVINHPSIVFTNPTHMRACHAVFDQMFPNITQARHPLNYSLGMPLPECSEYKTEDTDQNNDGIHVHFDFHDHRTKHPILRQTPIPMIDYLNRSITWSRSPWTTTERITTPAALLSYLSIHPPLNTQTMTVIGKKTRGPPNAQDLIVQAITQKLSSWRDSLFVSSISAFKTSIINDQSNTHMTLMCDTHDRVISALCAINTGQTDCPDITSLILMSIPLCAFAACSPQQIAVLRAAHNEGISQAIISEYVDTWITDDNTRIALKHVYSHMRENKKMTKSQSDSSLKQTEYNRRFLEYLFREFHDVNAEEWRMMWSATVRNMISKITGDLSAVPQQVYDDLGIKVYHTNERYMVSKGTAAPTAVQRIIRDAFLEAFAGSHQDPKAVILVKSPPGTGKTDLLLFILDLITEILLVLASVLIPTSRQLHASDIVNKLKKDVRYAAYNILHYKDKADYARWGEHATMLVCQMESLCRISDRFPAAQPPEKLTKPKDAKDDFSYWNGLLYLDEVSALFKQFTSTTMNKRILNVMTVLGKLCEHSKVILVSDADISLPILRNMRLMLGNSVPMHLIVNNHKPPPSKAFILASNLPPSLLVNTDKSKKVKGATKGTSNEINLTNNSKQSRSPGWVAVHGVANTLRHDMENVRKLGPVFFITGSKKEGIKAVDFCTKEGLVKESDVLFIHGDNANMMRSSVFKDITAAVRDKLLVVYTSAITQGVDINETLDPVTKELVKVKAYRTFLHIESGTCTVRDCLQMAGRARNKADRNLYITMNDPGVCCRTPIRSFEDELRLYRREFGLDADDCFGDLETLTGRTKEWHIHVMASMNQEDNISRACLRDVLQARLAHLNGSLVDAYEVANVQSVMKFNNDLPECLKVTEIYMDSKYEEPQGQKTKAETKKEEESMVPSDYPAYRDVLDRELHHIEADRNRLHIYEAQDIRENMQKRLMYEQLKYDLKPFICKCTKEEDQEAVWVYAVKNKGFKDHLVKSGHVMQAVQAFKCGRPECIDEQPKLTNLIGQVGRVIYELGRALDLEKDLLEIQSISRDKWEKNAIKAMTILVRPDVQQLFKQEFARLQADSKNPSLSVKSRIGRILRSYSLVSIHLNDGSPKANQSTDNEKKLSKTKRKQGRNEDGVLINVSPVCIKSIDIPGTAYDDIKHGQTLS